ALPAGLAPAIAPTPCDLDRPEQIAAATRGVDAVVHAAYGADADMAPQARRLLDAMAANGVPTLILLSSIAVYGERDGLIREEDDGLGALGPYGEAKVACERAARDWAAGDPARRALLLRPGVVYGPGSRFWIDKLRRRLAVGAVGDLGAAGEGLAPLIHVEDVARLAASAVRRLTGPERAQAPPVAALTLVGPETPSWNAYFAALASAFGDPAPRRLSPADLARNARLATPAKIWRRLKLPGFEAPALAPSAGERALFARKAIFATDATERLLGDRAGIGLTEGLRRSR
ncbi:NAD-dependent epimerase/dehydratase family protein, partial [Methylopila musalis]